MITSLLRTLIIYIVIIIAVRIMGKRQISELQTTELVVTLLISDLASIPMQDNEQPLTSGLVPIFVLISLEIFVSIFMMKNNKIRRLICGKPVLVVKSGEIQEEQLKDLRMSHADLFEALRQKDIFEIDDVKCAIIETNGLLSVQRTEVATNEN
ncbi:MAG: DUF421 domain-containing protein [Clostridia bacterium]